MDIGLEKIRGKAFLPRTFKGAFVQFLGRSSWLYKALLSCRGYFTF